MRQATALKNFGRGLLALCCEDRACDHLDGEVEDPHFWPHPRHPRTIEVWRLKGLMLAHLERQDKLGYHGRLWELEELSESMLAMLKDHAK
jgi:hypothetical protein